MKRHLFATLTAARSFRVIASALLVLMIVEVPARAFAQAASAQPVTAQSPTAAKLANVPDSIPYEAAPPLSQTRSMAVDIKKALEDAGLDIQTSATYDEGPTADTVTFEDKFEDGDLIVTGKLVNGRIVLTKQFKPLLPTGNLGPAVIGPAVTIPFNPTTSAVAAASPAPDTGAAPDLRGAALTRALEAVMRSTYEQYIKQANALEGERNISGSAIAEGTLFFALLTRDVYASQLSAHIPRLEGYANQPRAERINHIRRLQALAERIRYWWAIRAYLRNAPVSGSSTGEVQDELRKRAQEAAGDSEKARALRNMAEQPAKWLDLASEEIFKLIDQDPIVAASEPFLRRLWSNEPAEDLLEIYDDEVANAAVDAQAELVRVRGLKTVEGITEFLKPQYARTRAAAARTLGRLSQNQYLPTEGFARGFLERQGLERDPLGLNTPLIIGGLIILSLIIPPNMPVALAVIAATDVAAGGYALYHDVPYLLDLGTSAANAKKGRLVLGPDAFSELSDEQQIVALGTVLSALGVLTGGRALTQLQAEARAADLLRRAKAEVAAARTPAGAASSRIDRNASTAIDVPAARTDAPATASPRSDVPTKPDAAAVPPPGDKTIVEPEAPAAPPRRGDDPNKPPPARRMTDSAIDDVEADEVASELAGIREEATGAVRAGADPQQVQTLRAKAEAGDEVAAYELAKLRRRLEGYDLRATPGLMTREAQQIQEMRTLFTRYQLGTLSEADMARLQAMLKGSPNYFRNMARRRYTTEQPGDPRTDSPGMKPLNDDSFQPVIPPDADLDAFEAAVRAGDRTRPLPVTNQQPAGGARTSAGAPSSDPNRTLPPGTTPVDPNETIVTRPQAGTGATPVDPNQTLPPGATLDDPGKTLTGAAAQLPSADGTTIITRPNPGTGVATGDGTTIITPPQRATGATPLDPNKTLPPGATLDDPGKTATGAAAQLPSADGTTIITRPNPGTGVATGDGTTIITPPQRAAGASAHVPLGNRIPDGPSVTITGAPKPRMTDDPLTTPTGTRSPLVITMNPITRTSLNPAFINKAIRLLLVQYTAAEGQEVTVPAASEPSKGPDRARGPFGVSPRDILGRLAGSLLPTPIRANHRGELARAIGEARPTIQEPRESAAASSPPIKIVLTSLGRSSGDAFQMTVLNEGPAPVKLTGDAFVLEPVANVTQAAVDRELAPARGAGRATTTLKAYCLEFLKQPPSLGMVFRLAPEDAQRRFANVARIFEASRKLKVAGTLRPGAGDPRNPDSYFDDVRQWAIWTHEQGFDEKSYGRAFVEHSRKNVEAAGHRWTRDLERAFTGLRTVQWQAVQMVLREAAPMR